MSFPQNEVQTETAETQYSAEIRSQLRYYTSLLALMVVACVLLASYMIYRRERIHGQHSSHCCSRDDSNSLLTPNRLSDHRNPQNDEYAP
jgi:hypothetical protein